MFLKLERPNMDDLERTKLWLYRKNVDIKQKIKSK